MLRFHVYILKCADRSYYVGVTTDLEGRIAQHQRGLRRDAYTFRRRPVELVWSESFPTERQARECERQIKGWKRAKKQALAAGGVGWVHQVTVRDRRQRNRRRGPAA
jgi:predicted GIY-YIG superfamily endonuclease